MFRYVYIEKELPRTLENFNATFTEGLQMMKLFGLFFMIASILLFVFVLINTKSLFPTIIILLFTGIGYYFYNKTNNIASEREELFFNGEAITGEIVRHGRKFNIFKSKKDYSIFVKPDNSTRLIEIANRKEAIWSSSPIGSETIGLYKDGKYFFGEEVGCKFKFFNK